MPNDDPVDPPAGGPFYNRMSLAIGQLLLALARDPDEHKFDEDEHADTPDEECLELVEEAIYLAAAELKNVVDLQGEIHTTMSDWTDHMRKITAVERPAATAEQQRAQNDFNINATMARRQIAKFCCAETRQNWIFSGSGSPGAFNGKIRRATKILCLNRKSCRFSTRIRSSGRNSGACIARRSMKTSD